MKYSKINYPDGSFYPQIEFENGIKEDSLFFRINSYDDLWFLRQIKDICDHNQVKVHLTIPNLLDAQADRRFHSNESANLVLICEFINGMKWESVTVFHPHNPEVVEALINDVKIIDNYKFIKSVIYNELCAGPGFPNVDLLNNLILFSTDAGGFKPMMKLADKLSWQGETFSASKSRKHDGGKTSLLQKIDREDFGGKDILIIDDICVFGGTFIGLAEMLKEKNCGKLYLAVSHITVPNPHPKLFDLFDRIFTTDSKILLYGVPEGKSLEIVKFM